VTAGLGSGALAAVDSATRHERSLPAATPKSAPGSSDAGFQIPSLDGIRAASFMVVFLSHAGLGGIVPGYFGLTLFFFLSGYLITTLMRIEFDRTGTVSLSQFYLRRVLRIFPPFYLVLTLAWLIAYLGVTEGGILTGGALLAQALHVTNYYIVEHGWWDGIAPGTWVYWSLAVEEHFYLVFPLFYLVLRRRFSSRRAQMLVLFAICAAVLVWRCALVFVLNAPKDRTYIATDTRIDSILFGCIMAVWGNPVLDRESIDDRRLARLWLPLGIVTVVVSIVLRQHWFDQTLRYTLQGLGLLPFFVAAVVWHDRGPFRLLNLAPVRYMGVLSYSLYLLHTVVLVAVDRHVRSSTPIRGALALALLIGISTLIYRGIERPCTRIRKRLSKYLQQAPVARPALLA
jgi:peptidoglycan/LPS O-acetylase OafA/YrhL